MINSDYWPNLEDIFSSRGRVKLISHLILQGPCTISKLRNVSGMAHKSASSHLVFLSKLGLIKILDFGRFKVYEFRNDTLATKSIRALFTTFVDGKNINNGKKRVRDLSNPISTYF